MGGSVGMFRTIGTIMITDINKTETTSFIIVSRPHRFPFSLGMGSMIGSNFSPIPITITEG